MMNLKSGVALCQSCHDKLGECYDLTPISTGKHCSLCASTEARIYAMVPKIKARPRRVSSGTAADREAYLNRRRWA